MEKENLALQIINLCKKLDKNAAELYTMFSKNFNEKSLKQFWKDMALEEKQHVEYWEYLGDLAKDNMIPQIFDNPFKIKKELEEIEIKVDTLLSKKLADVTVENSFLLAYRMEFYLLHPAFERLFSFLPNIFVEEPPSEKYKAHINKMVHYINKYEVENGKYFHFLGETVKRLWDENQKVNIQSQHDELTGVLNRRGFFQGALPLSYLAHRNKVDVGLMMLDIDKLREINDLYGYQKGDEVIRHVCDYLRNSLRASDIIGRYDGDEFIVFLYQIEREKLVRLGEKILSKVKEEVSKKVKTSLNIGLVHGKIERYPDKEFSDMIMRADNCLDQAKTKGQNTIEIQG